MIPGAVQVTPGGRPLVLLADAGPTGGYPVIAVVIAADVGLVAQARPGERVRFATTNLTAARAALAELRAALRGGAAVLLADVPRDEQGDRPRA
jgi:allophanate hydrolase subunit 2